MPGLNSFGYRGGVSLDPQVYQNPLQALPPTNIALTATEVAQVTAANGLPPWGQLNPKQQSAVAARILMNRGDAVSQAQAGQILLSNPSYQVFQIIYGAALL